MFEVKNLSVMAFANGFTLWHYVTPDDDVMGSGYFDSGEEMFRVGDFVISNVGEGERRTTKLLYIATKEDGKIQVAKPN